MEDNQLEAQFCVVDQDTVTIRREEYIDLICARFAIEMIGHSFGKFSFSSPDSDLVKNICMHFGCLPKEKKDA